MSSSKTAQAKHTTEPDTMDAGYKIRARYKSLYPCSALKEIDFAVVDKCIQQLLIVHLLCARSIVKTHHFSVFAFQSSDTAGSRDGPDGTHTCSGTHAPFTER